MAAAKCVLTKRQQLICYGVLHVTSTIKQYATINLQIFLGTDPECTINNCWSEQKWVDYCNQWENWLICGRKQNRD